MTASGGSDPCETIRLAPMSAAQHRVVALTAVLSALDGFDILSITFVAPVLARAFGVGAGALGLLLSSGLVGTLVGSLTLAALADVIGRRPVALIGLAVMGMGMFASALCSSLPALAAMRVVTGLGIGAMVVVLNPIAVEAANLRLRSFAVAAMSIGYPLGGMAGGLAAATLLKLFDWRAVFVLGGLLALLLFPLVAWRLPESLSFLVERRRRPVSLARVNRLLARYGHPPVASLPPSPARTSLPYRDIFRGPQRRLTLRIAAVGVLVFVAIYFFLSWQPKLLVDMGFSAPAAASIASLSSFAGACGTALFGILSRRMGARALSAATMLGLASTIVAFGALPVVPPLLVAIALLAGALLAAATVGLYVSIAAAFPAHLRATGTGFVIGVGRLGSALAPSLAGGLFELGVGRAGVAAAMGTSAAFAGLILLSSRSAGSRHLAEES